MSVRLPPSLRQAVEATRLQLPDLEARLFDIICLSATLGRQLPQDDIIHGDLVGPLDPRPKLSRGIRRIMSGVTPSVRDWSTAGARLERRLVRMLQPRRTSAVHTARADALRSLLSYAPSILGIECQVPADALRRTAWTTVIRVMGAVQASRVARVDLPFIDRRRLRRLVVEAQREFRPDRDASGATPGLSGRRLAVDPRLAQIVGAALGERLQPAFIARYVFYSRPGEYFWPHTDSPLVHVNVFVCLEHHVPVGTSRPSAFVGYRPDGSAERFEMRPGQAIAAHTQGLIHAREPLQDGERVTLLAIALAPAPRRSPRKPSVTAD